MIQRNRRPMTRSDRKAKREWKRGTRQAKILLRRARRTLDWLDVTDIQDDCIVVGSGRRPIKVKGIKLVPHNIFIDDPADQSSMVEKLTTCLNHCPNHLYFGFVLNPVDLRIHIDGLITEEQCETDQRFQQMIKDDVQKAQDFERSQKELEFFVMIRDTNDEHMAKRLTDLYIHFQSAGLQPMMLGKRDYYDYLSYLFENPLVTDILFRRGYFSVLNEKYEWDPQAQMEHIMQIRDNLTLGTDAPMNIRPQNNMILRSEIAPSNLYIRENKMYLSNKQVTVLTVQQLPQNYMLGLLSDILACHYIKMFVKLDHLKYDFASMIRKEYREKKDDYMRTTDPSFKSTLEAALSSLQSYINEVTTRHDMTHNVTLVFAVYADDADQLETRAKDLQRQLSTSGCIVNRPLWIQEQVFKTVTPLWTRVDLPRIIQENLGFLLPSYGVAGLWPFVYDTLRDPRGFLMAHELENGGAILFDPFYYLNNPDQAKLGQRANGNIIVVGKSGSGKTTTMNLFIRHFIRTKTKVVWIDPENRSYTMTKKYNGTYIEWGIRGNIINIFDLKPISGEEDDVESEKKKWDTEAAIFNVIDDVNTVLEYLFPKMDERVYSLTGDIVFAAYAKVGIKKENGAYPPFKGMAYEQMPTFSTFIDCLQERIDELQGRAGVTDELMLLNNLSINMNRIKNEWSIYFNGYTTVNIPENGRQMISFATKKLQTMQENLSMALSYIMFTYAWATCLDEKEHSAFVIDEAHQLILKGKTAGLVSQFFRRSRKYHNSMVIGTQEPRDFADPSVLTDGKAIFNNSDYKIVMGLRKDACEDMMQLERINPTEADLIMGFERGMALFICGDRRIPVMMEVTPNELREMDSGNEQR
ncbi:MAG: hypothetical protein LKE48_09935 [Solobacterium sp.]|nr:hypothetical protein [Solobacterium sp.]